MGNVNETAAIQDPDIVSSSNQDQSTQPTPFSINLSTASIQTVTTDDEEGHLTSLSTVARNHDQEYAPAPRHPWCTLVREPRPYGPFVSPPVMVHEAVSSVEKARENPTRMSDLDVSPTSGDCNERPVRFDDTVETSSSRCSTPASLLTAPEGSKTPVGEDPVQHPTDVESQTTVKGSMPIFLAAQEVSQSEFSGVEESIGSRCSAEKISPELLSSDIPLPTSETIDGLADQFSKLRSLSASPAPPASMPTQKLERPLAEKPFPTSEKDTHIPDTPLVDEGNAPLFVAPSASEHIPTICQVTTYADATNLAMQFPELASHFLTCPLPAPKPAAGVPALPPPTPPDVSKTGAQSNLPPAMETQGKEAPNWTLASERDNNAVACTADRHTRNAPNWALAPDGCEVAPPRRGPFGTRPDRGRVNRRQLEKNGNRKSSVEGPGSLPTSRDRRAHRNANREGDDRCSSLQRLAPSLAAPRPARHINELLHSPGDPLLVPISHDELSEDKVCGTAISGDAKKEWDRLKSDPWADHLNAVSRPSFFEGDTGVVPQSTQIALQTGSGQLSRQAVGESELRKHQLAAITVAARRYLEDQTLPSPRKKVDTDQISISQHNPLRDSHPRTSHTDASPRNFNNHHNVPVALQDFSLVANSCFTSNLASSPSQELRAPSFSHDAGNEWLTFDQSTIMDDWLPSAHAGTNPTHTQASYYSAASSRSPTPQNHRSSVSGRLPPTTRPQSDIRKTAFMNQFRDQGNVAITPPVQHRLSSLDEMAPQPGLRDYGNTSRYRQSTSLPSQYEAFQEACGKQPECSQSERHSRATYPAKPYSRPSTTSREFISSRGVNGNGGVYCCQ